MTDSGGNVLGWAASRTSILECFDERDGSIDIVKYLDHANEVCSLQRCVTSAVLDLISGEDIVAPRNSADVADTAASREPRKRARKCVWARRSSGDGPLEVITPQESCWYGMYVSNLYIEQSEKLRAKFRSQFRLPYPNYNELLDAVQVDPLFVRWCGEKRNGKKSSPIELLLLGSLRYLGRGWTFDNIEESTAIDKEVHRVFFHKFIQFGSTVLFNKYVVTPVNLHEAMSHIAEYELAGLPGCVGSCDCTHITTEGESDRVRPLMRSSFSDMSLTELRKRLIVHFDILFKANKIVWPRNK